MGKTGNKDSKKKTSSGKRHLAKARQEATRIKMKIKRWKKNKAANKKVSRNAYEKAKSEPTKSRLTWNTKGMENRLDILEKIVKKG